MPDTLTMEQAAMIVVRLHEMFALDDLDEPAHLESFIAEIEDLDLPFTTDLGDAVRAFVLSERGE